MFADAQGHLDTPAHILVDRARLRSRQGMSVFGDLRNTVCKIFLFKYG